MITATAVVGIVVSPPPGKRCQGKGGGNGTVFILQGQIACCVGSGAVSVPAGKGISGVGGGCQRNAFATAEDGAAAAARANAIDTGITIVDISQGV